MTSEARKFEFEQDLNEQLDLQRIEKADGAGVQRTASAEESGEPTWFVRTYEGTSPTEMAHRYHQTYDETLSQAAFATPSPQAYEAYKRRLEERFRSAQAMADPAHGAAVPIDHKTTKPIRPTRAPFAPRAFRQSQTPPYRMGVASAMAATVLACAIGGTAGYVIAKPSAMSLSLFNPIEIATALFSGFVSGPNTQVATAPLSKTTPLAKIDVKDVSGPVNGPIPLAITASALQEGSPIAIRISGLPEDAYLTKGVHVANGEWLVKSAEINAAELVVPRSSQTTLGLEVAALDERTGVVAAPPKQMNVALDLLAVPLPGAVPPPEDLTQTAAAPSADVRVEPVSALPDQGFNKTPEVVLQSGIPQPQQVIEADVLKLINKGRALLAKGDVISARQFFLKAHGMKANDAAFYVGQTYDPTVFTSLGITALQPDLNLAAEWYGKAAAQGFAPAQEALMKLGSN